MMLTRLCIALVALCPTFAVSDEYSDRRQTCAPLITALFDDCVIHNFYRCADGGTYVETLHPAREREAMLFGADYGLLFQKGTKTGRGLEYVTNVEDPFSMEHLLSRGGDASNVAVMNSLVPGFRAESAMRTTTRLTDKQQVYSAGRFVVANMHDNIWLGNGPDVIEVQGIYLVDPTRRVMILAEAAYRLVGPGLVTDPNVLDDWTRTPKVIDIVGSESPHFMSQTPEDTCQLLLSYFIPTNTQILENPHDNL